MMIIQVNDRYRITADSRSYILEQVRTRDGVSAWKPIGWYRSLEQLVAELGERLVRESDAAGAGEVLQAIENARATLSRALTPKFEVVVRGVNYPQAADGEAH